MSVIRKPHAGLRLDFLLCLSSCAPTGLAVDSEVASNFQLDGCLFPGVSQPIGVSIWSFLNMLVSIYEANVSFVT